MYILHKKGEKKVTIDFERIFDSLKILTENGIRTSMVTNGLLATEDTLARLDELGLNSIQFSLDGNKASHDKLRNQAEV